MATLIKYEVFVMFIPSQMTKLTTFSIGGGAKGGGGTAGGGGGLAGGGGTAGGAGGGGSNGGVRGGGITRKSLFAPDALSGSCVERWQGH